MAKETKSKKKADHKSPAAPSAAAPLIDPSHSTAAAAAMVKHKVSGPLTARAKTESSTFRNLKESLSKPSNNIGGILDKIAPNTQKYSTGHASGGKQVGHNQTFGADVARRNVPRRTNG
jgi:hypothetical protein